MPDLLKVKKLISKGFAYMGMINEAQMRAVLLRQKLALAKKNGIDAAQIEDFQAKSRQIRRDLDKYSDKILKIHKELDSYGDFSELE